MHKLTRTWEAYFPWRKEPYIVVGPKSVTGGVLRQLWPLLCDQYPEIAKHRVEEFQAAIQHGQFLQVGPKTYQFLTSAIVFTANARSASSSSSNADVVSIPSDSHDTVLRSIQAITSLLRASHNYPFKDPGVVHDKAGAMIERIASIRSLLEQHSYFQALEHCMAIQPKDLQRCFWLVKFSREATDAVRELKHAIDLLVPHMSSNETKQSTIKAVDAAHRAFVDDELSKQLASLSTSFVPPKQSGSPNDATEDESHDAMKQPLIHTT